MRRSAPLSLLLWPCAAILLLPACDAAGGAVHQDSVVEELSLDLSDERTAPTPQQFTVITFNVGTTDHLQHDKDEDEGDGDGYTSTHAARNAAHYSNNLAWRPAEDALKGFLAETRPHLVFFQELFFDPWCEDIAPEPGFDFVCDTYDPEGPKQVERLLGENYFIACAAGHPDNCVGVRKDFGILPGCPGDGLCMGGLEGLPPPSGCTKGERVGTAVIRLTDGRLIHAVNAHTVAGMTEEDMACRKAHFEQIFVDRGDGKPAAFGEVNLVAGDMNTDPFIMAGVDPSADFWNQHVGDDLGFHYISSENADGPPTIATFLHIDHVVSDLVHGECVVVGHSKDVPPVMDTTYWDHRPVLCTVEL